MISKKISEDYELKLLEITAADETGSMNIFLKDGKTTIFKGRSYK